MTSRNKKKIALIEKYNQEKLRNYAMKKGVILKAPDTVFLSKDTNGYGVLYQKHKKTGCPDQGGGRV